MIRVGRRSERPLLDEAHVHLKPRIQLFTVIPLVITCSLCLDAPAVLGLSKHEAVSLSQRLLSLLTSISQL